VLKLLYDQREMKQPGRIWFETDTPGSATPATLQFTCIDRDRYHHQQQR
jgi:hypothetical protein